MKTLVNDKLLIGRGGGTKSGKEEEEEEEGRGDKLRGCPKAPIHIMTLNTFVNMFLLPSCSLQADPNVLCCAISAALSSLWARSDNITEFISVSLSFRSANLPQQGCK